jgi:hypothetical protein
MGVPSNSQTEPHAMPQSAVPRTADRNLRGFLASNTDIVTRAATPVPIGHTRVLSAHGKQPILFENFIGKRGFLPCDTLVKHRAVEALARRAGLARQIRQAA